MSNNNFKFDLSGMTREIQEINRALEQMGIVAQNVFNTVGRAADLMGTKVNQPIKSSSVILPGTDQMMTATGQQAMSEAAERSYDAIRLQQRMTKNPQGFITNGDDQIMKKTMGANGSPLYSSTGFTTQEFKRSLAAAQASAPPVITNAPSSPFISGRDDYSLARGYNQKDLPRLLGASEDSSKLIQKLDSISSSTTNANVGGAVGAIKSELAKQNEAFINALTRYNSAAPDTDDQRKSFAQLTKQMSSLESAIDDANQIAKDSGRFSGGGGGSGGGNKGIGSQFWEFLQKNSRIISSAVGLGVAGASAYYGTGVGLRNATFGKEMAYDQSRSSLASASFKQLQDSYDMSRAENMLKYRGDILFPGDFKYLGAGGFQRALGFAGGMQKDAIEKMQAERTLGMIGGVGGILGGLGTGLAMSAINPALGLLSGVGGVVGGVNSITSSYLNSPLTAMNGGLSSGPLGYIGGMMGISQRSMRMSQSAALSEFQNKQFSDAQMAQDLELQRNPDKLLGTQEYLDRTRAQNRAAELVGGYAMSATSMDGRPAIPTRIRNATIRAAGINRNARALQERGIDAADRAADQGYAIARDSFSLNPLNSMMDSVSTVSRLLAGGLTSQTGLFSPSDDSKMLAQKAARRAQETQAEEDSYKQITLRENVRRNSAISLGMSGSDYIYANAQATNALGGGAMASDSETYRLLSMSKGGLGSYESILGNLSGLNRVSGGSDNISRLEQIMATGVAAGFDKSRVATQFVQTTLELSKSLNVTSADNVARSLTFGASSVSLSGRADEKSLAESAKGIQDLAAFTSNTSGMTGSLGLMGIYGAGGRIGTGGGMLNSASTEQLMDYEQQLSSGSITDPRLKSILANAGGDKDAVLKQIRGATTGKNAGLRGQMDAIIAQGNGVAKKYGATTFDELLNKGRGLTGKARSDFMFDITSLGKEAAAGNGISEELGAQFGAQQMRQYAGFDSAADMKAMNGVIARGKALSINPAQVRMREFVESMYQGSRFDSAKKPVSMDEYKTYLDSGGTPLLSGRYGNDKLQIDQGSISAMEAKAKAGDAAAQSFLDDAKNQIGQVSRFDLAQNAQASQQAQEGAQRVYVTNMYQISSYMKGLDPRANNNSGSGQ